MLKRLKSLLTQQIHDIKNDVRFYHRQQQYRRQGWRWLSANDNVALAARLMFALNRYALFTGRSEIKDYIYRLKNCLLAWLYQNGYCVSVHQERQKLECTSCGGTGENWHWDDDYCQHCGGTGIYRDTILYCFKFDISGSRYIWHQPAPLVWWGVECDDHELYAWLPKQSEYHPLTERQVELYCLTVFEFLRSHQAMKYRKKIWSKDGPEYQWVHILQPPLVLDRLIRRNWRNFKNHLRWEWHRWRRDKPIIGIKYAEDEIPF